MSNIIKLSGTKDGTISVTKINKPYGEKSSPVVSIGISLAGNVDKPDWKVHIPLDNIDDLVRELQEMK